MTSQATNFSSNLLSKIFFNNMYQPTQQVSCKISRNLGVVLPRSKREKNSSHVRILSVLLPYNYIHVSCLYHTSAPDTGLRLEFRHMVKFETNICPWRTYHTLRMTRIPLTMHLILTGIHKLTLDRVTLDTIFPDF